MLNKEIKALLKLVEEGVLNQNEMLKIVDDLSRDIPESDDPLFNHNLSFDLIFYKEVLGYSVYPGKCSNDEEIFIPETYRGLPVIVIPKRAFEDCNELREIFLPDSLLAIDESAFYDCHQLEQIVLPNSVKFVGAAAFSGCVNLKTIVL